MYRKVYDIRLKGVLDTVIFNVTDNCFIPNNPDNKDWQKYQAWLAQGNKPLPPEGAK